MPSPRACNMLEIVSSESTLYQKTDFRFYTVVLNVCMPHIFDYQMFKIHKPDEPPLKSV